MIFGLCAYSDIFRLPVSFYFNGEGRRSSMLGLLFSWGIYIFLIYAFSQSDIFFKKSPIVVSQSLKTQKTNKIQFDESRLIAFGVTDGFKRKHIDPSIFNVAFKYYHNSSHFEYKELKPCTLSDVAFNTTLYDLIDLNNAFCLVNKSFFLEGDWDEGQISYLAVSLFLCNNLTSNGTCKSQEEIDAFFNKWSSFKFFGVIYHDSQIDLNDYKNPFKLTYKSEFQFIDTSIKKRFNIFLKTAHVHTDDGWIFHEDQIQSNIMADTKEFDFQMRTDTTQPVFQMLFYSSREVVDSTRRYQKLPEILGSMIGVFHLTLFICSLVTNLVIHVSTLKHVLNKLYFFPIIITKKRDKKLKKVTISRELLTQKSFKTEPDAIITEIFVSQKVIPHILKKIPEENKIFKENLKGIKFEKTPRQKTLNEDSFTLEHFSQNDVKPDEIKNEQKKTDYDKKADEFERKTKKLMSLQEKTAIQKKMKVSEIFKRKKTLLNSMNPDIVNEKNLLTLNVLEYFWFKLKKMFCCKPSPKYQLIEKAEKAYIEDMDIMNIMTKLHDLEKLKMLLLDENQLILFKYLSKSIIYPNNDSILDQSSLTPSQSKILTLIKSQRNAGNLTEEAYKKVLTNMESDKVNRRLIELFDERVLKDIQK